MGHKIVVGPINRGLRNDVTAFVIDNDSFPRLINAYQWRGRVKRKRGTSLLVRLQRFFNSTSISYNSGSTTITLNGSGVGNLLTGFGLQSHGNIVPGTVTLTGPGGPFTDPTLDGYLTPTGTGGVNTINYATGVITIPAQAGSSYTAVFIYHPALPVMGLEEEEATDIDFPRTLAFDTVYSYYITQTAPNIAYDVSFYKNPSTLGMPVSYIPKTTPTPTTWNGANYQQFWTTNYQGALWATNGITIPFSITNIGMQYKNITGVAILVPGPPATANLTIVAHGLVVGDFVYINEVNGITGINYQTGYVTVVVNANTVTVVFPNATLGGAYTTGGIAQYLTNRADVTKDSLRFFDGDPTNGNPTSPTLNGGHGWVNFAPPLSNSIFSISNLPAAKYYLVGARMILPFKDRLLFFGPVVQTSSPNSQIYLRDTIIYSQNGTPYYTSSFTGDPISSQTIFTPFLVPDNQVANAPAYFEDVFGFGGFVKAGIDQPIVSASLNEDVVILGFSGLQAKLIYSGSDLVPFNFFFVNSEFGTSSTFSIINMDQGVMTRGFRGFIITSQTQSQRLDLEIPDQTFQIKQLDNGAERITAFRDFITEWAYFTYPVATANATYLYPNQTLQYNYRDNSWGIFDETYTTYGLFRRRTGYTWLNIGNQFHSWRQWNEPWNAGSTTLLAPIVIAGNQQGFVFTRDDGTTEESSLAITSFSGSTVTCYDHCLNNGDFIIISECLGTVSAQVNNKIFSVTSATKDTFILNPTLLGSPTYLGSGLITRMYVPFIQTKQFPLAWDMGRKTRLGPQQYLLEATEKAQVSLLIFLSQNASSAYNDGPIVPSGNVVNSSLIYSTILYTCPESINIGLTPSNINLQTPTAIQQDQIWHRKNTSLIGDTVQVAITLSEDQMRSLTPGDIFVTITGASQAYPCVLNAVNTLSADDLIQITGVQGMTQLNFDSSLANPNNYNIISTTATTITIDVDSTAFTLYTSGGVGVIVAPDSQFAEIELHSFVLDVSPSQLLV